MLYELLLVDDEENSRNGLATYFPWEEQGFHICGQTSHGGEALDFIKSHKVHVVLTDISMPVMDGMEFLEKLQETGLEPYKVILSAYDEFQYARGAMRLGAQ